MGGLEIRAEKNSSAAKQAALAGAHEDRREGPLELLLSAGESSVLSASSWSGILDTYNILYRNLCYAPDSLSFRFGRRPFFAHLVSSRG